MKQETTRTQVARYEMLSDIVLLISETADFQVLLKQFVSKAKGVLDFDRLTLALLDSETQTYDLQTLFEARQSIPGLAETALSPGAGTGWRHDEQQTGVLDRRRVGHQR